MCFEGGIYTHTLFLRHICPIQIYKLIMPPCRGSSEYLAPPLGTVVSVQVVVDLLVNFGIGCEAHVHG